MRRTVSGAVAFRQRGYAREYLLWTAQSRRKPLDTVLVAQQDLWMDPEFVPGLELSRLLYEDSVRPILAAEYPRLRYSAARIDGGSEVLGFDTARSADHAWGPRLQLFLSPEDAGAAEQISTMLSHRLPKQIHGWSTNFRPEATSAGGMMEPTDGPVDHRVEFHQVLPWFTQRLGSDTVVHGEPTVLDWLSMPQQFLAVVTGGEVFHDGLGELSPIRRKLSWYPDSVWRYLLACQWMKLSQEEAFVGRTAEVGDELGSAMVASRQVREMMRLALLMSRRYAPYSKWLGTAFSRQVPDAAGLEEPLRAAMAATDHEQRQDRLCDAYEELARRHNVLGLTEPLEPSRRQFFSRPFQVIIADRFAAALRDSIADPALRALPFTGSVDQWADNTDLLGQLGAIRAAGQQLLEAG